MDNRKHPGPRARGKSRTPYIMPRVEIELLLSRMDGGGCGLRVPCPGSWMIRGSYTGREGTNADKTKPGWQGV